ncbi:MAG: hypothetical protein JSW65_05505 [Candidatus Bipolaricaulota bacterium]|nr:MAG: hypothetical protein JSW65_05505 [Candidatus Bipolaricaulota bacterium]
MEPVHSSCGYEIYRSQEGLHLVDRETFGVTILAVVAGVLGLLCLAAALIDLSQGIDVLPKASPSAPIGVGVALVLLGAATGRIARRRGRAPLDEVASRLILDRPEGILCDPRGVRLAALDCLRVSVHIDWWTRGMMCFVRLSWPDGRRVVHRAVSRRRARAVVRTLVEYGVRERGRASRYGG